MAVAKLCPVEMEEAGMGGEGYQCGKPVKFKIPKEHAFAGRTGVCGTHARSYNKMAERLGWEKATPVVDKES